MASRAQHYFAYTLSPQEWTKITIQSRFKEYSRFEGRNPFHIMTFLGPSPILTTHQPLYVKEFLFF